MTGSRVRGALVVLAWAAWVTAILQVLYRGEAIAVVHAGPSILPWYVVEWVACVGAVLGASLLGRRARLALFALPPVALLAIAAGAKRRFLGEPARWSDVALVPEGWSLVSIRSLESSSAISVIVLLAVAAWFLGRALPLVAPSTARARLLTLLGVVLAFTACALAAPPLLARSARAPSWRTRGGGIVADVLARFDAGKTERTASLSAVVERAQALAAATHVSSTRPHVVVVLSESFWDPTLLPAVHFDRDPLPTYHALRTHFPSGMMLTPQFGGGTANVEFEVLTGLSMRFLPAGALAYTEFMKRDVDSVAAILRRAGWTATAISPWPSWYTNCQGAYEHLGFDRFVSGEFLPSDIKGKYLPDDVIAEEILARIEQGTGPQFIFANTAENHYPFPADKFRVNTVHVTGLDDDKNRVLESYAQGVADADAMLAKLVARLGASKEPAMIVWFGDHLPALPVQGAASMSREQILAIYVAAGWVSGDSDPQFLEKMHRTPALVWDNFLPESHDALSFSASYLGAYALRRANLPTSPRMAFDADARGAMPLLPPAWSTVIVPPIPQAELSALERDALTGQRRLDAANAGTIAAPDFEVGLGALAVARASRVTTDGNRWTVVLTTTNVPPRAHVLLDGVDQARTESTWRDAGQTTLRFDAADHPTGAKVVVEFLVMSLAATAPPTEGKEVVARSNKLEITLVPTEP